MNDQLEKTLVPTPEVLSCEIPKEAASANGVAPPIESASVTVGTEEVGSNGMADTERHARAGRKGARRLHQLIHEGRLYEKEHGLKRGRQRLRQLIELGKLYEREHNSRPAQTNKRRERLSRMGREELLATFLQCLMRLAKPSFRGELARLAELLASQSDDRAA